MRKNDKENIKTICARNNSSFCMSSFFFLCVWLFGQKKKHKKMRFLLGGDGRQETQSKQRLMNIIVKEKKRDFLDVSFFYVLNPL
jgi:hypothetical protein